MCWVERVRLYMGKIKALESTFLSEDDNDENDDSDKDDDDNYDNDKDDDDAKPGSNIGRIQVAWDTAGWSRGWRRRERAGCWPARSPVVIIGTAFLSTSSPTPFPL